jgi:hypothetical protein
MMPAVCMASGMWSAAPTCDANACSPVLVAPVNGSVSATTGTTGDVVFFSCDADFALTGLAVANATSISCLASGSWSDATPTCDVVNHCATPTGGQCNFGSCIDGVNTFTCECNVGYTGAVCDVNIDECATTPCSNGAQCNDGIASFTCTCLPGFSGALCATTVPSGQESTNAAGAELISLHVATVTLPFSLAGAATSSVAGFTTLDLISGLDTADAKAVRVFRLQLLEDLFEHNAFPTARTVVLSLVRGGTDLVNVKIGYVHESTGVVAATAADTLFNEFRVCAQFTFTGDALSGVDCDQPASAAVRANENNVLLEVCGGTGAYEIDCAAGTGEEPKDDTILGFDFWVFVGIAGGAFVLLVVGAILVYCCCCIRRTGNYKDPSLNGADGGAVFGDLDVNDMHDADDGTEMGYLEPMPMGEFGDDNGEFEIDDTGMMMDDDDDEILQVEADPAELELEAPEANGNAQAGDGGGGGAAAAVDDDVMMLDGDDGDLIYDDDELVLDADADSEIDLDDDMMLDDDDDLGDFEL